MCSLDKRPSNNHIPHYLANAYADEGNENIGSHESK